MYTVFFLSQKLWQMQIDFNNSVIPTASQTGAKTEFNAK